MPPCPRSACPREGLKRDVPHMPMRLPNWPDVVRLPDWPDVVRSQTGNGGSDANFRGRHCAYLCRRSPLTPVRLRLLRLNNGWVTNLRKRLLNWLRLGLRTRPLQLEVVDRLVGHDLSGIHKTKKREFVARRSNTTFEPKWLLASSFGRASHEIRVK